MVLGTDIKVDFEYGDLEFGVSNDFQIISEENNLQQAVYLRLITPKGSLPLHPEYGSELYILQGEPHDDETLSKAILYTYDALSYEPRIEEVVDIQADWVINDGVEKLQLNITIKPIQTQTYLNVVITYEV